MGRRKDPNTKAGAAPAALAVDTPSPKGGVDWESRALARVQGHVREVAGPTAAQAGWETETITRLEDYFDRGEV